MGCCFAYCIHAKPERKYESKAAAKDSAVRVDDFGLMSDFWDYSEENGPNVWADRFESGKGNRQSPINIDTSLPSVKFQRMEPLRFNYEKCKPTSIINTGNGFQVNFDPRAAARIAGGPLKKFYQLVQFHAHWGESSHLPGSEHLIDGTGYPAELHLVHYNTSYASFTEALKHPDGLCVVGVFLNVTPLGSKINPTWQRVSDTIHLIDYTTQQEASIDFPIQPRLLMPKDTSRYFSYEGSLTTPPLAECVTWLVMADGVNISDRELTYFRDLRNARTGRHIEHNSRPVQPLNNRMVIASFQNYKQASQHAPISSQKVAEAHYNTD